MPEITIDQAIDLALEHQRAGRLADAESIYRQVLNVQPENSVALGYLGTIAYQAGMVDDAIGLLKESIRISPAYATAHNNLGNILLNQKSFEQARAYFVRAIELDPTIADAHYNLGLALYNLGEYEAAILAYQRAIDLQPTFFRAIYNLAQAYRRLDQNDLAMKYYNRVLELEPDFFESNNQLGLMLKDQGKYEESLDCFCRALNFDPGHHGILDNIGQVYKERGEIDKSLEYARMSLAQNDTPLTRSNLLLALHYKNGLDPETMYKEHREYEERFAKPLYPATIQHKNNRSPERRLKIGYLSPDFYDHSVATFILPLLGAHNHEQFHITCYSIFEKSDRVTETIRSFADQWHSCADLDEQQIADLVRKDEIDILIGLAGHTAENRLLVFARKPAPVQVNYLGYPNTTGLDAVDYWITDEWNDPPGQTENFCSEAIVRLPDTFACYSAEPDVPPVDPILPLERNGFVTFASFNMMPKLNDEVLLLWSKVLHRVPQSKLLIQNHAMRNQAVRESIRTRFAAIGIEAERLNFLPPQATIEHLKTVTTRADICLDTFPFTGHTVSLHTLFMGVPFVTLAGTTHVSRRGVSILQNIGLPDLTAANEAHYIEIAAKLAADLPRLKALRGTLREKMLASPLMDASRFARNIEAAYREMWRTWCSKQQ